MENSKGFCVLCPDKGIPGTLEHMLLECPALSEKRELIFKYWNIKTSHSPALTQLIAVKMSFDIEEFVQFVFDPSVLSEVILGCQEETFQLSDIFELKRTFCYAIHRRRLQLIGRFNC